METLWFRGRNVYTQLREDVTITDLLNAKEEYGSVAKAYFFELAGDREVRKAFYDRKRLRDKRQALMLEVQGNGSGSCFTLSGLERVVSFLAEGGLSMDDVPYIAGRYLTAYYEGSCLLGIALMR